MEKKVRKGGVKGFGDPVSTKSRGKATKKGGVFLGREVHLEREKRGRKWIKKGGTGGNKRLVKNPIGKREPVESTQTEEPCR